MSFARLASSFALLASSAVAQPSFVGRNTFHDDSAALDSVIVPPACLATVYNLENQTFSYDVESPDITNAACAEPIRHAKAALDIIDLDMDCDVLKTHIIQKGSVFYASGPDPSQIYDPRGRGNLV